MSSTGHDFLLSQSLKDKIIDVTDSDRHQDVIDALNALKQDEKWTDKKKWQMDFFKSAVLWLTAIIVTLVFLNKIDDKRNASRYLSQKLTDLRINSINSFKKSSLRYLYAKSDIFWKVDASKSTYNNFQSYIFDEMNLDIVELNQYYRGKDSLMKLSAFRQSVQEEFDVFIKPVIKGKKTFSKSDSIHYRKLSDQSKQLRNAVIDEASNKIFPKEN